MKGSVRIARVAGIDIGVHWTFWLLIAFFVFHSVSAGADVVQTFRVVAYVMALFLCVVLHELGHALTARRFGVQTKDITLLPIGGMARLNRIPDKPIEELLIAVAGPLVNVVIAAMLAVVIVALGIPVEISTAPGGGMMFSSILVNLAFVNVFLVVFNMLPAFPMDGGRVLRSLLAMGMAFDKATDIAARVGGVMAFLFAALALVTWNPILFFIALFVFIGGQAESHAAQTRYALKGLRVRDAMMTEFHTLTRDQPLSDAIDLLLAGSQQDFPVLDGDRIAGVLTRKALLSAVKHRGLEQSVGEAMDPSAQAIDAQAPLGAVLERLQGGGASLPVLDQGRLVGLLSAENIGELLLLRDAGLSAHRPA